MSDFINIKDREDSFAKNIIPDTAERYDQLSNGIQSYIDRIRRSNDARVDTASTHDRNDAIDSILSRREISVPKHMRGMKDSELALILAMHTINSMAPAVKEETTISDVRSIQL